VAVVRGCCDSEDAYTFIHLRSGRAVYVQSGYGGRLALMGDVGGAPRRVAAFHDTFTEIVLPESRGNANAIGVLQYGPFAGPARRYLVTGPEGMGRRFESLRFVFWQPDADFSPADARAGSRAAQYAVRLVLVGFRYDDRVVVTIPIAADTLDVARAEIPEGIRVEAVSGGR